MNDRLARWYGGTSPHTNPELQARLTTVAGLVNKVRMQDYANRKGLPLPRQYASPSSIGALDVAALPSRVVIKPDNLANGDCVMLFDDDREVISGKSVPIRNRNAFVRRTLAQSSNATPDTMLIAEEFICDADPRHAIPLDFKVFVAGGWSWIIQVVDRNGPASKRRHRFYTRDWTPFDEFQTSNALDDLTPRPSCLPELLRLSDRIAQDIGCFMRLDFYISDRGVLFGEFTPYPNAGRNFTELGNRELCDLMDCFPDPF